MIPLHLRRPGRSRPFIQTLPTNCAIVCPPETVKLYRDLVAKTGRIDIEVLPPEGVRGREFTSVWIDEAVPQ